MKNTDYAFAVGTIRALENGLLTDSVINQVIDSTDIKDAVRILSDGGYAAFSGDSDYETAIKKSTLEVYNEIADIVKDNSALNFLIVKNDFHNLKCVLKSIISNKPEDAKKNLIYPSVFDGEELLKLVSAKDFEKLPKFISKFAEKGYDIITATLDGQQLDIFMDNAALTTTLEFAKDSGSTLATEYAVALTDISNIKTAIRFSEKGNCSSLIDDSLALGGSLDTDLLALAAKSGLSDVLSLVETTDYPLLAEAYRKSGIEFERLCDNIITEIMRKASIVSFGPEPLFAYYYAKLIESQAIRIILCCKECEMSPELIRERVRELYV